MPPSESKSKPAAPPAPPEPRYPQIEAYVERASAEEIELLFGRLRDELTSLKGARAEHGKKVAKAIARTEELLLFLLEVRQKLEAARNGGAKGAPAAPAKEDSK